MVAIPPLDDRVLDRLRELGATDDEIADVINEYHALLQNAADVPSIQHGKRVVEYNPLTGSSDARRPSDTREARAERQRRSRQRRQS